MKSSRSGGKIGLFGGAGAPPIGFALKVIMELINNIAKAYMAIVRGAYPSFFFVGKRTREGNDLYMEIQESGVL